MTGNLVALAAFFMLPQPPTFAVLEVVSALHGDRGADPGEAIDRPTILPSGDGALVP